MLSANRFPSPRSNSREPVLRAFVALDATRIEVDPLALLPDGRLAVLGASLAADDNALFAQPALPALQAEDAAEQTEGVVPIGEFGGMEAQDAADFIRDAKPSIPIVAVVVGRTAPSERRRGPRRRAAHAQARFRTRVRSSHPTASFGRYFRTGTSDSHSAELCCSLTTFPRGVPSQGRAEMANAEPFKPDPDHAGEGTEP